MNGRMTRNLTQTELARRAGISRQALGTIESGAYHPVAVAPTAPHLTLAPAAGVVKRTGRHRADVDTFQLHNEIESTRFVH